MVTSCAFAAFSCLLLVHIKIPASYFRCSFYHLFLQTSYTKLLIKLQWSRNGFAMSTLMGSLSFPPQISINRTEPGRRRRRRFTNFTSLKFPSLIGAPWNRFRMSVVNNGASNSSRIGDGDASLLSTTVLVVRNQISCSELAEPSIRDAFVSCVKRGAKRVIVSPFSSSPVDIGNRIFLP